MATTLRPYIKVPATAAALLTKLQGQGLAIANVADAEAFLSRVSYYRFRGYLYPYFDLSVPAGTPRKFKVGATFEKSKQMYCFDEDLRKLVFGLIPEVEIALRTTLDSTIAHVANHGFWYLQPIWFKNFPDRIVNSLQLSFCKSAEPNFKHYHSNYYNSQASTYKGMPPFWMICELSTIGQLNEIFASLKEESTAFGPPPSGIKSTVLDKMSHDFGAAHYRDLANWVSLLRDLRNICAHHGRCWNRNFRAPAGITSKVSKAFPPINPAITPPQPNINKIYSAIIVLRVICKNKGIDDGLKNALVFLLTKYPEAAIHLNAMGMPHDWQDDTVWS